MGLCARSVSSPFSPQAYLASGTTFDFKSAGLGSAAGRSGRRSWRRSVDARLGRRGDRAGASISAAGTLHHPAWHDPRGTHHTMRTLTAAALLAGLALGPAVARPRPSSSRLGRASEPTSSSFRSTSAWSMPKAGRFAVSPRTTSRLSTASGDSELTRSAKSATPGRGRVPLHSLTSRRTLRTTRRPRLSEWSFWSSTIGTSGRSARRSSGIWRGASSTISRAKPRSRWCSRAAGPASSPRAIGPCCWLQSGR